MGNAEDVYIPSFCMEELVWEASVNYLEYGSSLSNVVSLSRTQ